MLELTDNPDVAIEEFVTARNIAEELHKNYPDHLWAVSVEGEQGIATVRNLRLSGNMGFIIKLKDIPTHTSLKKVALQAGGELLERYRMARGRYNEDAYSQLHSDHAGLFKPDE